MSPRTLLQFLLDPGCRAGLVAIMVWRAAVLPAVCEARTRADGQGVSHVRALDSRASSLLVEGHARSATFNRLLDALDESDLFVFVETGFLTAPARLTFAAASPAARFVRITLNVPEAEDRLIAWLAHELQHAVEIASAVSVRSPVELSEFYQRTGQRVSAEGQCPPDAQKVTALVLAEIGPRHFW